MDIKDLLRPTPTTDVMTSSGRIYLYPLRSCDITEFKKIKPAEPSTQIRQFLSNIASLTIESDENPDRIPLSTEIVGSLSEQEIEKIAEAYTQYYAQQKSKNNHRTQHSVPQNPDETRSEFMLRIIKTEVENNRQMYDDTLKSNNIFYDIRHSTSALDATLGEYANLARADRIAALEIERWDAIAEQNNRRENERENELDMVRLTAKMTAESSRTLSDLSKTATTLMEQLNERSQKSDQSTRKQIRIAIWSVASSAVIAILSLAISILTYVRG